MPHVLTDFFTHLIPLMRDINQWVGGREVSRDAISTLLGAKEAVVLVPGGQQEIFSTRSSVTACRPRSHPPLPPWLQMGA